jgi:hypothetical protein
MTHVFNRTFRRTYFIMKAEPRFSILLLIYSGFILATGITGRPIWLLMALAWCSLFVAVDAIVMRHGRCISYITPSFYILRLAGTNYIYQYRKKDGKTCDDMKKDITFEQNNLLNMLPAGRYITITFPTVILRLLVDDNVSISRCEPVYKKSLHGIQNKMLGCKKCDRKQDCGLRNAGAMPRRFYYIEFIKYSEEQPVR